MSARLEPAAEHRLVAGRFADVARAASADDWDRPAPVAGWTARDVVRHLVEWLPGLLESGAGIRLAPADPATLDAHPAAAWEARAHDVQALLDDPGDRVVSNPHFGDVPLAEAIDRFYTADVFMHTWDLARALGVEPPLDEGRCAELLAGMEPMDAALRSSGQYGARVPVAADALAQDRLMGFIGRDPSWHPTT